MCGGKFQAPQPATLYILPIVVGGHGCPAGLTGGPAAQASLLALQGVGHGGQGKTQPQG